VRMTACRTLRTLILATIASPCSRSPVPRPDPREIPEALVQVYGARAMVSKDGSRCILGGGQADRRHGLYRLRSDRLRLRWSDSALVVRTRQPDAPWFGSAPELYAEKRGPASTSSSTASTRRCATIPTRGVHALAGPELQHVHRLDRAPRAGARARPAGHRHRQGLSRQHSVLHGAQRQRLSVLRSADCLASRRAASTGSKSTCSP